MRRSTSLIRTLYVSSAFTVAATAAGGSRAGAQISVLSSTVEEHVGGPGESYVGRIEIANPGRKSQVVRLYHTDYHFAADGTSAFDAPSSFAHSNAAWISIQSEQVTVPAASSVSVPYTVSIPKIDSLHGTYWSTVMVEPAEHTVASAKQVSENKTNVGIGTVIRYAVQVATHIGMTGARTVRFQNIEAKRGGDAKAANAGNAAIELDVLNAGDRGYRPSLWIELYDAQGTLRAKAKQQRGLLYPGCSLRQRFELGTLPAGTYKAVIFADTGEETVYASQYTIAF